MNLNVKSDMKCEMWNNRNEVKNIKKEFLSKNFFV